MKRFTHKEAVEQAKKLMAMKPKKRFRLPDGFYLSTDAVATDGCKITVSEIRQTPLGYYTDHS